MSPGKGCGEAPVYEYVKVCPQFGAGFFVVPGTDGCLRVGGRVRADYVSGRGATNAEEARVRTDDLNTFRARGYIFADHRQNSDIGLVRAFTRLSLSKDNSSLAGVLYELAFVQVGGLTAGKFTSPYDVTYYSNGWAPLGLNGVGAKDNTSENGIAYTAALGGGMTASLALMSSAETSQRGAAADTTNGGIAATTQAIAGGQSMPDIVAAFEMTQGWGSVKIAAAAHQTRYTVDSAVGDSEIGYGVQGGVKVNLPMIAAGDFISVQGAYASGANLYGGVGTFRGGKTIIGTYDVNATTGKLSTAWGIVGGMTHFWTKTVDTHVYGGYARFENGSDTASNWTVSQYTKWSPIAGLQLGVETSYRKVGGTLATVTDKSDWSGRLRVQRDF